MPYISLSRVFPSMPFLLVMILCCKPNSYCLVRGAPIAEDVPHDPVVALHGEEAKGAVVGLYLPALGEPAHGQNVTVRLSFTSPPLSSHACTRAKFSFCSQRMAASATSTGRTIIPVFNPCGARVQIFFSMILIELKCAQLNRLTDTRSPRDE